MSKRLVTVAGIDIPAQTAESPRGDEEQVELAIILRDGLTAGGCYPAGTKASQEEGGRPVLDPGWGADLGELIIRSEPHEINELGVPKIVAIDLNTLQAEVDRDGEVCAWLYAEG